MKQNIKIQIISRDIPVENTIGNATYILSFMGYLKQADCEIEYTLLRSSLNGRIPWYMISSRLAAIINISAKDNFRIGRLLLRFNSLLDWVTAPISLTYKSLPHNFKNRLKTIRDRVIATPPGSPLATPDEIDFASTEFLRCQPDVVVVNYTWLANIFDAFIDTESTLRVILTHDVLHERVASFESIGANSDITAWSCQEEANLLRKAQVLLAIQEQDAKTLKQMAPLCDVISMPMAAAKNQISTSSQVRGRCLFVGSDSPHNFQGLQWFLEKIWPLVLEEIPHSILHVCGSVGEKIQGNFLNVKFLGKVDDLSTEHSAAEVCLVPLLAGSGLKIKLVEALSYGRVSITTSIGIQGLQEIAGKCVIVADSVDDFAAAVCLILKDSQYRRCMEEQIQSYVDLKLSPESVYQPFIDRIHQQKQINPLLSLQGNLKNEI
jgi:Glycosyl transferases group 1